MRHDFTRRLDHASCNKAPTDKLQKLRDGGGLYLYIEPSGARGWRFYYQRPVTKKQNTISFGSFPGVGLSDARAQCDAARAMVAKGIDPSVHKQQVQRAAVVSAGAAMFQKLADDFFAEIVSNTDPETQRRTKIEMNELTGAFGPRSIDGIEPIELGELLKAVYKSGRQSKARRVRSLASRIFCYGISEGVCKYDIAAPFKGRFKSKSKKRAAITDQLEVIGLERTEQLVGKLMRDIRDYRGEAVTIDALELMALTFPRPANVVKMEWAEIDFAINAWVIPAEKMKMDRVHKVPLSRQAIAILKRLHPLTGKHRYVFAHIGGKPLSKNAMTNALKRLGYDTSNQHCAHGFRSMASTLLNEWSGWSADAVERQLAHGDEDKIRGTYNKAEMWDERVRMMQHWADQLDRMRDGNVVQLQQVA
jgi:integrase